MDDEEEEVMDEEEEEEVMDNEEEDVIDEVEEDSKDWGDWGDWGLWTELRLQENEHTPSDTLDWDENIKNYLGDSATWMISEGSNPKSVQ